VCNHEMLASSQSAGTSDTLERSPDSPSTPRSKGRRIDDDQSGTRLGDPDMRLARLPTEPARPEPTPREIQLALRREACANAVAHDRERIAEGLYDSVIHRLFAAGLQLQATCQVVDAPAQVRIETTIDLLDATIAELRKAIFSLH
jgi:signal transduction histidine kinase